MANALGSVTVRPNELVAILKHVMPVMPMYEVAALDELTLVNPSETDRLPTVANQGMV